MHIHADIHIDTDTPIVAERTLFTLSLGEEATIYFGMGTEGHARPEAVAAITDRMIERLMVIRETALKQAVREGDQADAANFIDFALRKEARASVALDHDPQLETQSSLSPMLRELTPYEIAQRVIRDTGEPPAHDPLAHRASGRGWSVLDEATTTPDSCPRCAWNVAQAERRQ